MISFTKGTRFRARRELQVCGIIVFGAPCSGGFEGVLPAGEVLVLDQEPLQSAKGMWLVPERYADLEARFVPERDRRDPAYGGYAIGCTYDQVGRDFEVLA